MTMNLWRMREFPFKKIWTFFTNDELWRKLGRKKIKSEPSSECIGIYELHDLINTLLKGAKYVARSEYAEITPAYEELDLERLSKVDFWRK